MVMMVKNGLLILFLLLETSDQWFLVSTSFLESFQWFQLRVCHRWFLSTFQNVKFLTYAYTLPIQDIQSIIFESTTSSSTISSSKLAIQQNFIHLVRLQWGINLSLCPTFIQLTSFLRMGWIDHQKLVTNDHNVYDPFGTLILETFCIGSL